MKQFLFCSILFCFSMAALAQIPSPLTVDSQTIALWNFNNDPTASVVLDSGPNALHGNAQAAAFTANQGALLRMRNFSAVNSFIDFGTLSPSHPLDLENQSEWTIEFVIFPLTALEGKRNIFDNGRLSVELRDNRLEARILRNGVWTGVSTSRTLNASTYYRVAVVFDGATNELGIKVNNQTWAVTKLEYWKRKLLSKNFFGTPILIGGIPREPITDVQCNV